MTDYLVLTIVKRAGLWKSRSSSIVTISRWDVFSLAHYRVSSFSSDCAVILALCPSSIQRAGSVCLLQGLILAFNLRPSKNPGTTDTSVVTSSRAMILGSALLEFVVNNMFYIEFLYFRLFTRWLNLDFLRSPRFISMQISTRSSNWNANLC